MKIKSGFISNSSSTSYIVAVSKQKEVCPCCGRVDPDLLEMLEKLSTYNDDNRVVAMGKRDVCEHLWDDEKDLVKESINLYDSEKWDIAYIDISYHDDDMKTIFQNMVKGGSVKVIYSYN